MAGKKVVGKTEQQVPLNLDELRDLFKMLDDNKISEFNIEKDNLKLQIKREQEKKVQYVAVNTAPVSPTIAVAHTAVPAITEPAAPQPAESSAKSEEKPPQEPQEDLSKYQEIKSPMVGTFYRSPAPDAPSFVEVGTIVEKNTTLCIVEAMKLMNEIKAGMSGKIYKILVANGHPVEYDQPMFLIEPY